MWKILKEIAPNKINKPDIKFTVTDNKPEEFNQYFAIIGRSTYGKTLKNTSPMQDPDPEHVHDTTNTDYFRPQSIDVNTVILTIKDLNITSAVGLVGISLKYGKDILPVIAFILTCIINTSIVTGVFPSDWKHAVVVPISKNGDVDNVGNFF